MKETKSPFYEKIPKESEFYKHYMALLYLRQLDEVTKDAARLDRQLMCEVNQEVSLFN